jgi:Fe-S cluster assembly iron-binding protein IscA
MALDEPRDDDEIIQSKGFSLLVDKKFLEQSGGLEVDYMDGLFRKGLQIKEKNNVTSGC